MNKEHGQREEAATSFISLVLSQNFTKALKERGKIKKKKSKKREKQTKCQCFYLGIRKGEEGTTFCMRAEFLGGVCPLESQRILGMVGCLPKILLCYSFVTRSAK